MTASTLKIVISILFLIPGFLVSAQNKIQDISIDSVKKVNPNIANQLKSVQTHNDLSAYVGEFHWITILQKNGQIRYYDGESDITLSVFNDSQDGKIKIEHGEGYHYSHVQRNPIEHYSLTIRPSSSCDELFTYANYHYSQINGPFIENCLTSDESVEGN